VNDIPEAVDSVTISVDSVLNQITLRWNNPTETIHGTPIDTLSRIHILRNGESIGVVNLSGIGRSTFDDQISRPDFYRYELCAEDTSGQMGRPLYTANLWLGGNISGILIWELDKTPVTSAAISISLDSLNYQGYQYITDSPGKYPLENTLDVVFVCLGIYPNNHVLTDTESELLRSYLHSGGNVYMEGGDTWFFDPLTLAHTLFQINAVGDGSNDLAMVNGAPGTLFQNYSFPYSGENNYIDEIEPTVLSQRILSNPADNLGTAVANHGDGYNTIGASFEFGGLVDQLPTSTKAELLGSFLEFFGLVVTNIDEPGNSTRTPSTYSLSQNYPNPFNPNTTIEFQVPVAGEVSLKVYNLLGEEVATLVNSTIPVGSHSIEWNASNLSSGLYLYRLKAGSYVETRKMVLMK
jgi:hypothetical protein